MPRALEGHNQSAHTGCLDSRLLLSRGKILVSNKYYEAIRDEAEASYRTFARVTTYDDNIHNNRKHRLRRYRERTSAGVALHRV